MYLCCHDTQIAYGKVKREIIQSLRKIQFTGQSKNERKNYQMKFKKKICAKKETERTYGVKRVSKNHETAKTIVTAFFVAVLTFTFIMRYDIDANDVKESTSEFETMGPSKIEITTIDTTTSAVTTSKVVTTTTTKTATAVTTNVTTTEEVTTAETSETSEAVQATEPVYVVENPRPEPIPESTEIPEIEPLTPSIKPEPEPTPEPTQTIEESYPEETNKQIYYTDDGDNGYSWYSSYADDAARYHEALNYVSEAERIWLCNITANEYGSDCVPVAEKAKIVAVVMNRLADGYWGNSIQSVLEYPSQFSGYWTQYSFYQKVTPSCIDAVDYYFAHSDEWQYKNIKYISGDGRWNYFS